MRLVTEMVGQLDLHRSLHQPLGQLAEKPAPTDDLLLGPSARQQLVHELVRQLLSHLSTITGIPQL